MANRGPPPLLRRQRPLGRRHEEAAAAAVRALEFGINNLGRRSMVPLTPPLRVRLPMRPLGRMADSGRSLSATRTARRRANLMRQMMRRVRSGRVNKYS